MNPLRISSEAAQRRRLFAELKLRAKHSAEQAQQAATRPVPVRGATRQEGWDGDGDGMGMGWGWDGDGMGMGWGWGWDGDEVFIHF